MRVWLLHCLGALVLMFFLSVVPECSCKVHEAKIVNESIYPLTAVKLVRYFEDGEAQAQAVNDGRNLLPVDAEGYTIALDSGNTGTATFPCRQDQIVGAVTFFVNGAYQEYVQGVPVDLTEAPENSVLVMRVIFDEVNAPQLFFSFE